MESVLTAITTAINAEGGLMAQLPLAIGVGVGIALFPWGGKIVWGIVKKFSK